MENTLNVSSEEELIQLLSEGKISQAEYHDLLGAIRKTPSSKPEGPHHSTEQSWSKRKLGLTAFVLMLSGIILPAAFYLPCLIAHMGTNANLHFGIGPSQFLVFVIFELVALVLGVIAWADVFGKATVITIAFTIVLLSLFSK